MGAAYDPRDVLLVVGGVPVLRKGAVVGRALDSARKGDALHVLLDLDPHAEAMVSARVSGEFEVSAEAQRALWSALFGGTLSAGGRLYPDGARGCFHDGCDATTGAEEGGAMWCRFAEETRR